MPERGVPRRWVALLFNSTPFSRWNSRWLSYSSGLDITHSHTDSNVDCNDPDYTNSAYFVCQEIGVRNRRRSRKSGGIHCTCEDDITSTFWLSWMSCLFYLIPQEYQCGWWHHDGNQFWINRQALPHRSDQRRVLHRLWFFVFCSRTPFFWKRGRVINCALAYPQERYERDIDNFANWWQDSAFPEQFHLLVNRYCLDKSDQSPPAAQWSDVSLV